VEIFAAKDVLLEFLSSELLSNRRIGHQLLGVVFVENRGRPMRAKGQDYQASAPVSSSSA